jgi:hypothetical protein
MTHHLLFILLTINVKSMLTKVVNTMFQMNAHHMNNAIKKMNIKYNKVDHVSIQKH